MQAFITRGLFAQTNLDKNKTNKVLQTISSNETTTEHVEAYPINIILILSAFTGY